MTSKHRIDRRPAWAKPHQESATILPIDAGRARLWRDFEIRMKRLLEESTDKSIQTVLDLLEDRRRRMTAKQEQQSLNREEY